MGLFRVWTISSKTTVVLETVFWILRKRLINFETFLFVYIETKPLASLRRGDDIAFNGSLVDTETDGLNAANCRSKLANISQPKGQKIVVSNGRKCILSSNANQGRVNNKEKHVYSLLAWCSLRLVLLVHRKSTRSKQIRAVVVKHKWLAKLLSY